MTTKYQRYNASAKGRAREARRRLNPARAESQATYEASTKGIVRKVQAEVRDAHQQRDALAQEN